MSQPTLVTDNKVLFHAASMPQLRECAKRQMSCPRKSQASVANANKVLSCVSWTSQEQLGRRKQITTPQLVTM